MAQRMQQEEVVEILQGRDTRAYLESQMAEIRALRAEVAKMRKEQAAKEAAAQREKENPYASGRLSNERQREAERGRRELADAEGELLSMRQKWALVQQSLKGEQAKFVDRNAGKLAVSDEIPDAMKEEMKAAGVYQGGAHEAEAAGGEEVEAAQEAEMVVDDGAAGDEVVEVVEAAGDGGEAEGGGEGEMPTAAEMGLDQPDEFKLPENPGDRTKRKLNTARAVRKKMESAQGGEGEVLTGEVPEDEDPVKKLADELHDFFNEGASEQEPAHVERGERVAKKVRGRAAVVRWMKRVAATAAAAVMMISMLVSCGGMRKAGSSGKEATGAGNAPEPEKPSSSASETMEEAVPEGETKVDLDESGAATIEIDADELEGLESAGDLGAILDELQKNPEADLADYDLDELGAEIYAGFMERDGSLKGETGVMANYEAEFKQTNKLTPESFGTDKSWVYDLEKDREQTMAEEMLKICRDQPETLAATVANYPKLLEACGVSAEVAGMQNVEERAQAVLALMNEQTNENGGGGELQQRLVAALGIQLTQDTTEYEFYLENGWENTYYMDTVAGVEPGGIALRTSGEQRNDSKQVQITFVYADGTQETGDYNTECGFQANLEDAKVVRMPVRQVVTATEVEVPAGTVVSEVPETPEETPETPPETPPEDETPPPETPPEEETPPEKTPPEEETPPEETPPEEDTPAPKNPENEIRIVEQGGQTNPVTQTPEGQLTEQTAAPGRQEGGSIEKTEAGMVADETVSQEQQEANHQAQEEANQAEITESMGDQAFEDYVESIQQQTEQRNSAETAAPAAAPAEAAPAEVAPAPVETAPAVETPAPAESAPAAETPAPAEAAPAAEAPATEGANPVAPSTNPGAATSNPVGQTTNPGGVTTAPTTNPAGGQ